VFHFIPEKDLRGLILELIRNDDKSISKITDELRKKGHDYHRLVITGYLKALADVGILKEKLIPPAKVYTALPHKSRSFYELIGGLAKARNLGFKKEALLCTQVLEALFKRPVFQTELNQCGYDEPSGVKKVSGDDRSEARSILSNAGLKVGPRENAYVGRGAPMEEVIEVLAELVLEMSGTRSLRKETKQTTLNL
jgi:hypothetical protein